MASAIRLAIDSTLSEPSSACALARIAAMNPGITTLEGCRLDGGFNTGMSNPLGETIRIRNCVVQGNVFVYAYYTDVTGNMVMGGTLTVHSNGGTRL